MKVTINYREGKSKSLSASIRKEIDEVAEPLVRSRIMDAAEDAVMISPVDTGAFVTSWSIVPSGSGAGRSRKSRNKPTKQDPTAMKAEALTALQGDLAGIKVMETNVVLRNRSPHAVFVQRKKAILAYLKDRYR